MTLEIRKATLARLVLDSGMTFKAIGELYGVSRDVIAGMCRRYGLRSGRGSGGRAAAKVGYYIQHGCRWIDGDVQARTHVWCGKPCVQGRSYCEEHLKRAYYRRRKALQRPD